ncbi:hypothetical protein [Catenuloplanes atrovinosus]|uniref:Lipoprotein n=1 Tax=Catenuloplanes atrovinosus TaxID=137266 RepID=A0AAE4CFI0_9ACTN|nr:hypothetical protein [Catenuloplanes atrovinosus]MDR7281009.1 hypothetical protein [Catenuloplanes atrovinosus]
MDRRILWVPGVAVAGALALGGCAENGEPTLTLPSVAVTPTAVTTTVPPSAADTALAASTQALGTTSYKTTMTIGDAVSVTGQIDPAKETGDTTTRLTGANGGDITIQTRLIGTDAWAKVTGLGEALPAGWMHLDTQKASGTDNFTISPGQTDPAKAAKFIAASADVQQTGPNGFSGTVDLTKVAGVTGLGSVTLGNGTSQKVPFTATTDAQGRLSNLTVDLQKVSPEAAGPLKIDYTDYGTPVTVQPPAPAEVTEAPEELYNPFG